MYLDAKEVLGLSCNGECRLEGDDAVDVGHGGSADVGIAVPRTGSLPRKVVGRLHILHDGRDAVVVIGGNGIVVSSLALGILYVCQLLLPCRQLLLQVVYLCLVGIVLLSQGWGFLHRGIGYLREQVLVLCLQLAYLRLQQGYLAACLTFLFVQFRKVEIVF